MWHKYVAHRRPKGCTCGSRCIYHAAAVAVSISEAQTPENPSVDTHNSVNLPSCGSGSRNNGIRLSHLLPPSPRRLCVFPSSSSYTVPPHPSFHPRLFLSNPPFIRSTILSRHPCWSDGIECKQIRAGFKVREWSMRGSIDAQFE